MKLLTQSFIFILFISCFAFAQDTKDTQAKKLTKELLLPTEQDLSEAEMEGLNVFKILPHGMFDFEKNSIKLRGGGAVYSFTQKSHSYNKTPQIGLVHNKLMTGFAGADYGFIVNIGQTSFESAKYTSEANFLSKYQPPKFIKEIRAEQKKANNYKKDGMTFKNRLPVNIGDSYLLRKITFSKADILVYFKVNRQNQDGSLIIYWETIKTFKTPYILRQTDEELSAKIRQILTEKGFNKVTFEVKDNVVTLRGVTPKGKMAEAVMTVQKTRPRTVENQLTEERN